MFHKLKRVEQLLAQNRSRVASFITDPLHGQHGVSEFRPLGAKQLDPSVQAQGATVTSTTLVADDLEERQYALKRCAHAVSRGRRIRPVE
jgi:hypothetical protein